MIEREDVIEGWNTAWEHGLWATPRSRVLEGLTARQAVWKPGPERHSVWQVVHHLFFWREVTLRRARGEPRPDKAEIQRRNWEEPGDGSESAWLKTVRRYEASHQEMVQALRTTEHEVERFLYHLFHDNYHIGQIMQLRALQGFAPIE